MITAEHAQQLRQKSQAFLNEELEKISVFIKQAAEKGDDYCEIAANDIEEQPLKLIMKELAEKYGYGCRIREYPAGTKGLVISW